MAAGRVLINGIDIRAIYGADVYELPDPPSPILEMRVTPEFDRLGSPRKIKQEIQGKSLSLRFSMLQISNESIQTALEGLGALVGWQGGGNKDVNVELLYSLSNGALAGTKMQYRCVIESFNIEYIHPVHIQIGCIGTMRFRVLEALSTSGTTTQTLTVPSDSTFLTSHYFTDINCIHGSTPMRVISSTAGTVASFALISLAHDREIIYSPFAFTRIGSIPLVAGQFGFPAMAPALSNIFLSYPGLYSLAFRNNRSLSVGVRFKRNYTAGDATNKYLFQDVTAPLSIHIAATSQNVVLTFPGGTISISGFAFSDTNWNSVMAVINGAAAGLYVYNGSTSTNVGNTGGNPVTNPTGAAAGLLIGNNSTGNGPAKCAISEVVCYKNPLDATAISEWLTSNNPTSRIFRYDLNRNLQFLLDFTKDFNSRCNRGAAIVSNLSYTSAEQIVFDSQRVSLRRITSASGAAIDDSRAITHIQNFYTNFEAQVHNKLVLGASDTAASTYLISYEPRNRR